MRHLSCTLLPEGGSDRCLEIIIGWLLKDIIRSPGITISVVTAELGAGSPSPRTMSRRMTAAVRDFPCDLLFVHRDADRDAPAQREKEIGQASSEAGIERFVPVVPVRMTEAWLLIDEAAIRRAADRPDGDEPLRLPPVPRLEQVPDPKRTLESALRTANAGTGRRAKRFNRDIAGRKHRVAELIEDFSPLRRLSAFIAFESATRKALNALDLSLRA